MRLKCRTPSDDQKFRLLTIKNLKILMDSQDSKYGLPVSCRIPAKIKLQFIEEAKKSGVTLASYVSTFIVTNCNEGEIDNEGDVKLLRYQVKFLKEINDELKIKIGWYSDLLNLCYIVLGQNKK
jgi:hypothetical protein